MALDAALVDLAREAGATVRERTRVTDVLHEHGRVTGVRALTTAGPVEYRAPVVVGADGVAGVVARRLGMIRSRPHMRRMSLVAHLRGVERLTDYGEMHVGREGYCGLAPLGDGLANLAMVLPPRHHAGIGARPEAFFREMLERFGDLGPRSRAATFAGPILGTGPLSYAARALVGDGVLLAGDAGGFYDPFTGQGVYKALRSAMLAAPVLLAALADGDTSRARLLPYEDAREKAFRGTLAVEWLIQRFLGHPRLLARALHLLARRQQMADTLVGVTGDVLPARRVLSPLFLARLAV
jgi:flavin-dependent dehydrogenase